MSQVSELLEKTLGEAELQKIVVDLELNKLTQLNLGVKINYFSFWCVNLTNSTFTVQQNWKWRSQADCSSIGYQQHIDYIEFAGEIGGFGKIQPFQMINFWNMKQVNEIGDEAVEKIAEALKINNTLTILYLGVRFS